MRIIASMMILIFLTASLYGCTAEEFCGDVAKFDNNLPIGSDYALTVLQSLPCPSAGPTVAGGACWIVKSSAIIYKKTTEICLGLELATCITSAATNGTDEGCEEAEDLAKTDQMRIAFLIHDMATANAPSVGDIGNNLTEFAPKSYLVVDDLSNTTWEFSIDEEGNVYHFF